MSLALAVTMDSQGVVRDWTPSAEALFGYTPDQALGRSLGDLIVPTEMRPYHEMGLRRYVETREPHCVGYLVELEAVHKQGHPVPIQMKILPREVGRELFLEAHISGSTAV